MKIAHHIQQLSLTSRQNPASSLHCVVFAPVNRVWSELCEVFFKKKLFTETVQPPMVNKSIFKIWRFWMCFLEFLRTTTCHGSKRTLRESVSNAKSSHRTKRACTSPTRAIGIGAVNQVDVMHGHLPCVFGGFHLAKWGGATWARSWML